MMPFVWSMIGEDAGEKLVHIIARKEAERLAGAGQFWWGLGTPLGEDVERQAILNGRALHALFSEPKKARPIDPAIQVRVWNGWCSISGKSRGDIPKHVLVTSGYDPKKRKQLPHYALICHSDARLSLGKCGFLDPVQCRTFHFENLNLIRVKDVDAAHPRVILKLKHGINESDAAVRSAQFPRPLAGGHENRSVAHFTPVERSDNVCFVVGRQLLCRGA